MADEEEKCPACGQGPWKASNPVVDGFVTGCLCSPSNKLLGEAMHMLLYVDAHMASERMPLAKRIADFIKHPWPPYPDARDEDDDDMDEILQAVADAAEVPATDWKTGKTATPATCIGGCGATKYDKKPVAAK